MIGSYSLILMHHELLRKLINLCVAFRGNAQLYYPLRIYLIVSLNLSWMADVSVRESANKN